MFIITWFRCFGNDLCHLMPICRNQHPPTFLKPQGSSDQKPDLLVTVSNPQELWVTQPMCKSFKMRTVPLCFSFRKAKISLYIDVEQLYKVIIYMGNYPHFPNIATDKVFKEIILP